MPKIGKHRRPSGSAKTRLSKVSKKRFGSSKKSTKASVLPTKHDSVRLQSCGPSWRSYRPCHPAQPGTLILKDGTALPASEEACQATELPLRRPLLQLCQESQQTYAVPLSNGVARCISTPSLCSSSRARNLVETQRSWMELYELR